MYGRTACTCIYILTKNIYKQLNVYLNTLEKYINDKCK